MWTVLKEYTITTKRGVVLEGTVVEVTDLELRLSPVDIIHDPDNQKWARWGGPSFHFKELILSRQEIEWAYLI